MRAKGVNGGRAIVSKVHTIDSAIDAWRANSVHTVGVMKTTSMDRMLARGRARRVWRAEPAGVARLTRERAGLTQSEMAELLGVDRSAVSRWEAGVRAPRPEVLARYLKVLEAARGGEASADTE